jgi:hypothetical protein
MARAVKVAAAEHRVRLAVVDVALAPRFRH